MTDIATILKKTAFSLATDVAPVLEGHYASGTAGLAAMIAHMSGELYDGAAARLMDEIESIQSILQEGGLQPGDAPASLKISDLSAARDRLAIRLIELQAQLETTPEDQAKQLNTRIWRHLLATAAARMPSIPDFSEPNDA